MSNRKKTNNKRKKKRSNNSINEKQILYVLIGFLLFFISMFGLFNQGIVGQLCHGWFVTLFGVFYQVICIYLFVLSIFLFINKTSSFFTSKWGKKLNILLLLVYLYVTFFTFKLYTNQLVDIKIYTDSLNHGSIYATGLLGYYIAKPIIILIGPAGYVLLLVVVTMLGIITMFDIKAISGNIFDKYQAYKLKRVEKNLEKKAKQEIIEENNPMLEATQSDELEVLAGQDYIDSSFDDEPIFNLANTDEKVVGDGDETIDIQVMAPSLDQQQIKTHKIGSYKIPSLNLLNDYSNNKDILAKAEIIAKTKAKILLETLETFNLKAKISNICVGPSVTKYELVPEPGVKITKFNALHDDLAYALAAKNVRIEAPIPGKSAIGIEIPNDNNMMVGLREVLASSNNDFNKKLQIGLGKDIYGDAIFCEIDKTPHLLIAGSTGSGKSVCVNSIIVSILTKSHPDDVKLVMIDPKKVELTPYNGIPHLLAPVVTEPKKASIVLQKMVKEMERRYELFSQTNTRNIQGYNEKINDKELKLPYIVIIVDELADLMMVASKEVETSIARLAQMARAAGMHLIIATQRPSTDVITGLIKANIPSRIAFAVSSSIDSRTILDQSGAEQLLGKGDMLLSEQSSPVLKRIQGAFLSDEEIHKVVEEIKSQVDPNIVEQNYQQDLVTVSETDFEDELDSLYEEVENYVIQTQKASASLIQRQFKVGYNRALRILDQLEAKGIISENEGTKPRRVLVGGGDGY